MNSQLVHIEAYSTAYLRFFKKFLYLGLYVHLVEGPKLVKVLFLAQLSNIHYSYQGLEDIFGLLRIHIFGFLLARVFCHLYSSN